MVEAMKSHSFVFQGFTRSYWDFYLGYGLFAAINSLIEAGLFWQLALLVAKGAASQVGVIIGLFILANLCYLILSWKYFFITPMIFDIAIIVSLVVALISTRAESNSALKFPMNLDAASPAGRISHFYESLSCASRGTRPGRADGATSTENNSALALQNP